MILQGKVQVNGKVIRTLGEKIDPSKDAVCVEGKAIENTHVEKIYIIFHKPRGCVTTVSDPEGRPTVMDYFQQIPQRIYPVGRLDFYSEGLLILTNDGDVANKIMHPKHEVMKIYEVKVFGAVTEDLLRRLRKGVLTEDGLLKPESVRIIKQLPQKTWMEFRLCEGKNREIRRLCESVGMTIDKLKRVAIANLTIDGIAPGSYDFLTKKQLFMKMGWSFKDEDYQKVFSKEDTLYRPGKRSIKVGKMTKNSLSKGRMRRADDKVFMPLRPKHYAATMRKKKIDANIKIKPKPKTK
jgi:23S rRNA pseudouridine2605 synthase